METYALIDSELPLARTGAFAARMEALGYDGVHAVETVHDSVLVAAFALAATTRLQVRTAVTVAFARSPMLLAVQAWDLASMSGGRFELGVGSQIRANVVDRFAMPWGDPVQRMRDYLGSLRAIFSAFQDGHDLDFDSEYYRFHRLQPVFNPGPIERPDLPVWLGAVNPRMLQLAGEVADGLVTHPTNTTPEYLAEVCRPALVAGARQAGRDPDQVRVIASCRVITGARPHEIAEVREKHRQRLALVLSTPAYRWTLERHGFGEVQDRLRAQTRRGAWDALADAVDDSVLRALTLESDYADLPERLDAWLGPGVVGCVVPPPTDPADDAEFAAVLARIKDLRPKGDG